MAQDQPVSARRALVLGGGGARGAYQAGAVRALMEIADEAGIPRPFSILSGLSAGAINVAYLAAHAGSPGLAAPELANLWSGLTTERVFRVDVSSLARIGLGWFVDLAFGGLKANVAVKALLDTSPLRGLLRSILRTDALRAGVLDGSLESVMVTAANYQTLQNVTFVQAGNASPTPSDEPSARRIVRTDLGRDHVLASAAIPIFFPPVSIDGQYYGDGTVKNTAPLSGATKMGAASICAIGVHRQAVARPPARTTRATTARLLGALLDTLFMDYLDTDVERLGQINRVIEAGATSRRAEAGHRQRVIRPLYLLPSEEIGPLALRHVGSAPGTLRYLMRGLGSESDAADLISYLLFEAPYCSELVEMGYRDTRDRKEEVRAFLQATSARNGQERSARDRGRAA